MKRFYCQLLLFICVLAVNAQGIVFFHGSFEEALKKAKTEKKGIFVDVYTSWCGPCRMMATKVFPLKEVGDFYNQNYVCLKLDAEKEKEHGFFKHYKAGAFPTYFWLDAEGNLLDIKTGTATPEVFIGYGQKAKESDLGALLEAGRKRWESGERSLELVNDYVMGPLSKVYPEEVKPCLLDYLSTLSETDLQKEENYWLMKGFMRGLEDNLACRSLFKYASVYQAYEKGYTYWVNMYRMVVRSGSILRDDPVKYEQHMALLADMGGSGSLTEMYMDLLALEKQLFQADFSQGLPKILALCEQYKDHPYLYGQLYYTLIIAGFFDDSVQDAKAMDLAVEIAEKALKATPCKETLLYKAAAYAKKGDYKTAYELTSAMPFFPTPMLSNALYGKLHLPVIHREYVK